jgi:hypothetical protein
MLALKLVTLAEVVLVWLYNSKDNTIKDLDGAIMTVELLYLCLQHLCARAIAHLQGTLSISALRCDSIL